jgi:hypothetical protein
MTEASTAQARIAMYVAGCNGYSGRRMVQVWLLYRVFIDCGACKGPHLYDQHWQSPGVSFN